MKHYTFQFYIYSGIEIILLCLLKTKLIYNEVSKMNAYFSIWQLAQFCKFVLYKNTWFQRGYSVPCMTTSYSKFANHQIRYQVTSKKVLNLEIADGHTEQTLTLTVLVVTIDAQWEGMGDVGSASTSRHYFPHARP